MTQEHQSALDRAEIKIKVISNGLLVKNGDVWLAFANWERASLWIGVKLHEMEVARNGTVKN